ncbi:MAG: transposase, partial [Flavobacteriales bacterium]
HLKQLSSDGEDFVYWVHIAISNLKRNILGIYHFVKQEYLQNYLDEFVYRLNQRKKKCIFNQVHSRSNPVN